MSLIKAIRSSGTKPFKFERKGDTIKGYYLNTTEETINGSPVKKHVFLTPEGSLSVLGQADMYSQLTSNNCLKSYVEVTFTGNVQKLKGGKTMKLYDVQYDPSQTVDAASIADVSVDDSLVDEDLFGDDGENGPASTPLSPAASRAIKAPTAEQQAAVQARLSSRK